MSSESISIKSTKTKSKWVCRDCGYESTRYLGRCVFCNSWGTMQETILTKKSEEESSPKHGIFVTPESELLTLAEIPDVQVQRYQTGFGEFDRTLGGGVVPGSLTLIGGNPGVGKSTLLLQVAAKLGLKVLYVSAEESSQQLKIRASRLGLLNDSVDDILVYTENNLEKIVSKIKETEAQLVIIDSIQAIYLPKLDSIPGSVSQIREVTSNVMRLAKSTGVSIMIVGHITKEGDIAGPKILEHMVDTVLQFEGEKDQSFRILRSIKNRFGSTDEVGIFDMSSEGLQDITNPSELFLKQRSGGIVVATREGKRSLLLELQSLVVDSEYNNPRRLANGIELSRLHQILAVLEKKIGLSVARSDVYLNVVGGLNIREPAADLAVALSIYTNATDFEKKNSTDNLQSMVALGEIGLAGEIRAISNLEARLKEAEKLGFTKAIIPYANLEKGSKSQASFKSKFKSLEIIAAKTLRESVEMIKES